MRGDPVELGTILSGTYEIVDIVGRGATGAVWAARHLRLPGRRVAIKTLHGGGRLDPDAYARFRHEAEIIARLGHPHIVAAYDFNELPDGTPYIVLELLKGESLRRRLERGPLPLETVLELARQIGSALSAAHREGIIHRDLKPDNIFLCAGEPDATRHDEVKVLDFGVSKIRDSDTVHTRENSLIGTPAYMAPEQALGRSDAADQRTDVFALGAIIYEMLSGRRAFPGDSFGEVLLRVMHESPAPLEQLVPLLPAAVTSTVASALAKDPDDRFPDVASLLAALTPGEATVTSPPASSARTIRDAVRARAIVRAPPEPTGTRWQGARRVPRSARVGAAIVGTLAVTLALYAITGRWVKSGSQRTSSAPLHGDTITVIEFENQRAGNAENDWYRRALQAAFNTELSKIPQLSVVAPEMIQRTAQEEGLDQVNAARHLGVSRFVAGSFAVFGEDIRIDARIVDTSNGVQVAAGDVEGKQTQFFSLQKELALAVLDHFRIRLTEAEKGAFEPSKASAALDKYRMLLQAEGVTSASASEGPRPAEQPSSFEPRGSLMPRVRGGPWLATQGGGVAYAQEGPAAEDQVRAVLETYRRAHETGDLKQLADLYVALPQSVREAVHSYSEQVADLHVELADVKIQPRDHEVAVSYIRRDRFVDKESGEPLSLEVRLTKFLVEDEGKWKFKD